MINTSLPSDLSVVATVPDGSTSIDITNLIMSGSSFEWSLMDTENPEPLFQIGGLTIAAPANHTGILQDIDPLTVPWLATFSLIQISWNGEVKASARIKSTSIREFFSSGVEPSVVQIELSDKLEFALSSERSSIVLSTTTIVSSRRAGRTVTKTYPVTGWLDKIKALISTPLLSDGSKVFEQSDLDTTGLTQQSGLLDSEGLAIPDGLSIEVEDDQHPIVTAATLAASRGYFLWCNADEDVQLIPFGVPITSMTPTVRLASSLANAIPEEIPVEISSDEVEVRGSAIERDTENTTGISSRDWPLTLNTNGFIPSFSASDQVLLSDEGAGSIENTTATPGTSGVIRRKVMDEPQFTSNKVSESSKTYARKFLANSSLQSTAMVLQETEKKEVSSSNNFVYEERTIIGRAKTLIDSDTFDDDFAVVEAERTIVDYSSNFTELGAESEAHYTNKVVRHQIRRYSGTQSAMLEERDIEQWRKVSRSSVIGSRERFISKGLLEDTLEYTMVPDPNFVAEDQHAESLPQRPVRPAEEEVKIVSFSGVSELDNGVGRRRVVASSSGINSQAVANAYSRRQLLGSSYRKISFDVFRGVRQDDTMEPLLREDIGVNALVRDGLRIEFGQGQLILSYTGYKAGNTTEENSLGCARIDFAALETLAAGTVISLGYPDESITSGNSISIPLGALGGDGNYTFTVSGAPAGSVVIG